MQQSLFETLTGRFADGTPLQAVPPGERRLRSVIDHLGRLLNTREGSLPHLPGYGLPDISEVYRRLPDAAVELAASVARTVERYEPRLRGLEVSRMERPGERLRLCFLLTAELDGCGTVRFHTSFASSGSASVEPWKAAERTHE